MPQRVRELGAEMFGAFCIVFVGSGSIMMNVRSASQAPLLAAGISYAFIIAAAAAAMAHLSAHFNPAVTVGMVVSGRTRAVEGLYKIAAQCGGAIVGAWVLARIFPVVLVRDSRVGGTTLSSDVSFLQGVALEAITTGILMIVILGVMRNALRPGIAAVVVGMAVGALILAIGPLTGASFNPARSLGPALISGIWEAQAVYWIGPVLGASLAAIVWRFVLDRGPAASVA
ncbi:MAG: aquaporin [Gemmatimonadota bacterium]